MNQRRWLALLLSSGVVVAGFAPGAAPAAPTPTLVGIRAAHHAGFDRVVFDFAGGLPSSVRAAYVPRLIADPSGRPVRIAGRAILRVRFEPAKAHNGAGPTAPLRVAFGLPNVMTVVRAGDFEGVTSYGVGLAKRTAFQVSRLRQPNRIVVDVRAAFATRQRPVFFLDRNRFVANRQPFFVARQRPVRADTPGVGVMDRLFAGPLRDEQAGGLRLIRSRATGFTNLRIAGGIARVQLTGGCNSGGSTVTIAGEIMPTLRALPTVHWVKIFDPAGTTEHPTGRRDSIPTCLEP